LLIDFEDEVLRSAFDRFDVDKNGEITKEELVQVLSSLGMDSADYIDVFFPLSLPRPLPDLTVYIL
jgi:hypothetical protein